MRKIFKLIKNTEGQSLVEAALVIFFVLTPLILGMIEFGWILNGKITLTSAAREGARTAIIFKTPEEASAKVQSAVEKSIEASSLTDPTTHTDFIYESIDGPVEKAYYDTLPEEKKRGKCAVITVTAKIHPIIGLYVHGDITLNAKSEMKVEE